MSESTHTPGPPPFVKLKEGCDDVGDPNSWDAWSTTPTGNAEADYRLGADYCDICLRKVLETENVNALVLTLTAMFVKITNGEIKPSPMEKGFLDCLARRAADRRQQLDSN